MNPAVVNEDVVHFEVGVLTGLPFGKFNEGVLQRLSCLVVSDNVTTEKESFISSRGFSDKFYFLPNDFPESAKYDFQIFIRGNRIELADE